MYVLSFKNSIFLCVMCAHTIYVAAKHHFAHKKNKNHSLQWIFVIYLDWLERGQNLKKVGFFAAYQTGHSYINLMRSFEFCTLLKIFWAQVSYTFESETKSDTFQIALSKMLKNDIFDLINLWNIIPNLLVSASVLFSTGMTFSDPSPRIQHFSLSLNSRTHSCPFKAYNLLLCEMVLMPNIHTLFCKICNLGWW